MDSEKYERLTPATGVVGPDATPDAGSARVCGGRLPAKILGVKTLVAAPVAIGIVAVVLIAGIVDGVLSKRPTSSSEPAGRGDECAWGSYRLPATVSPVRYDLVWDLTNSFASFPTFGGSVAIGLAVAPVSPAVRCVLVHASGLNVSGVTVEAAGVPATPASFSPDPFPQSDRLVVRLPVAAVGAAAVTVRLQFSGTPFTTVRGLYAVSYTNGSAAVPLVSTVFEASLARTAFPCLDEPALKAAFGVGLKGVPPGYTALSNMPAFGGIVAGSVSFADSPVMSTCECCCCWSSGQPPPTQHRCTG